VGRLAVLALRIVLVTAFVAALFFQVLMIALLGSDLEGFQPDLLAVRVPIVVITVLGILALQVTLACVWRLLTMVRRGTVFSHAAFRFVDVAIGAIAAAALLTFGLAVTLAPGEAAPPGIVLFICVAAVLVGGGALIVFVLRMLLAQAVARDAEAHHLRAELDEVI
jgi:hypothetical protein